MESSVPLEQAIGLLSNSLLLLDEAGCPEAALKIAEVLDVLDPLDVNEPAS